MQFGKALQCNVPLLAGIAFTQFLGVGAVLIFPANGHIITYVVAFPALDTQHALIGHHLQFGIPSRARLTGSPTP